jgi:hypothetical protein
LLLVIIMAAQSHIDLGADIHRDVGFRRSKPRSVTCEISEGVVVVSGKL